MFTCLSGIHASYTAGGFVWCDGTILLEAILPSKMVPGEVDV